MATIKNIIDGQRKAVIVSAGAGMVRFVGLIPESEWTKVRKNTLYTQRALLGATLHVQELKGQMPPVGFEFPETFLEGRGKAVNGKAMTTKLADIKAQRKAEREAFSKLNKVRAEIL